MKHDYLETSLWYREEIADPYQTIAELFAAADIAFYRKTIKGVVQAACSCRIWRKDNPGDLLYEFKLFESVINAAYLINKEKKTSPLTISHKDMFNPNLYVGWHSNNTEWEYFPRLLSFKEFSNPYLVFKRFFKHLKIYQWKQELSYLLDYALVKTSLFEAGVEIDTFSIYFHLTKLVEAAHLIDVREISHIGGRIKSRIKI